MISYSQWHSIRQAAKDEHLDALERVGITTMESHYFYMNEHGFSGYPSYLWSHHGPSAGTMALRTRYGLLQGKVPYETLKFGPTGERIFYGARYDVNGTNFIMFRNLGQRELPMRVAVSGNPELELFDCFGNMYTETAVDGEAVLQTSTLAAYIRLKAGQSVDMIPLDMGANLATTANFSYSTNFTGNLEQLNNDIFETIHPSNPHPSIWWGAKSPEKSETLEITLSELSNIRGISLFGTRADNSFSALLDFDILFWDGTDWALAEEVRSTMPVSDRVRMSDHTAQTWYLGENLWLIPLPDIRTDRLRVVAHRTTYGFCPDEIGVEAQINSWGSPNDQRWHIREVQIHGETATYVDNAEGAQHR
ncbi:MAG: hypothetical protein GX804_10895 [Lentisphaerae bacterium]|jgi:hypothetical protein|nr:hypothetical protein [Lentisphaerota bacterium]